MNGNKNFDMDDVVRITSLIVLSMRYTNMSPLYGEIELIDTLRYDFDPSEYDGYRFPYDAETLDDWERILYERIKEQESD